MEKVKDFIVKCPDDWATNEKWKAIIEYINERSNSGIILGFGCEMFYHNFKIRNAFFSLEHELTQEQLDFVISVDEAYRLINQPSVLEQLKGKCVRGGEHSKEMIQAFLDAGAVNSAGLYCEGSKNLYSLEYEEDGDIWIGCMDKENMTEISIAELKEIVYGKSSGLDFGIRESESVSIEIKPIKEQKDIPRQEIEDLVKRLEIRIKAGLDVADELNCTKTPTTVKYLINFKEELETILNK